MQRPLSPQHRRVLRPCVPPSKIIIDKLRHKQEVHAPPRQQTKKHVVGDRHRMLLREIDGHNDEWHICLHKDEQYLGSSQ
jgi:hypothetical protein